MADTLRLDCPGCGQTLEIDAGFIGGVCRCAHCGAVIVVDGGGGGRARGTQRPDAPGRSGSGNDFDNIQVVRVSAGGARPESPASASSPSVGLSSRSRSRSVSGSRSRQHAKRSSPLPLLLGVGGALLVVVIVTVAVIVVLASGPANTDPSESTAGNTAGDPPAQPTPSRPASNPWNNDTERGAQATDNTDDALAPIPDRLVLRARWEFDGDAGGTTDAAQSLNASPKNGAGVVGGRLILDGRDDLVEVPVAPPLNDSRAQMRIDLRFKADAPYQPDAVQVLLEIGGGERGFSIYLYNARLYCGGYNLPGGDESGWAGDWLVANDIEQGKWHVLSVELDAGDKPTPNALTATIDGRPIGSATGARIYSSIDPNGVGGVNQNARFHHGQSNRPCPFTGEIDFLRIYTAR